MKKMISCIAALAIIAAAPAATVFAAESAPATGAEASVTSETAYDVTDIRNITGRWKYQVAEEGKNVTAGVTDNGFIDVKEDGTATMKINVKNREWQGGVLHEYSISWLDDKDDTFRDYEFDKTQ